VAVQHHAFISDREYPRVYADKVSRVHFHAYLTLERVILFRA
jgi:hypothetical protein